MATFAITNNQDVLDALNYTVTNLTATGNIALPGNILVGNTGTGIVSDSSDPNTVYGYLYQYILVRYADSADGTVNFSTSPTNRLYYGLRNSNNPSGTGTGAADYVWYEATGGFGTDKFLFYSTTGGRQAVFSVATAAPTNKYLQTIDSTAIDLDIISSAFTQQIVSPLIYQRNSTAPATPTGGTYDFATLTLTPPVGWSGNIPAGNTIVWSSQNTFESPLSGTVANAAGAWTTPVATFADGLDGSSNFLVVAYAVANVQPATPDANTGSWNFTTSTGTPPTGNVTWSLAPSDPGADILWESTAVASIIGSTGTANNLTWSTPFASGSVPGADGVSVYYYSIFQTSATTPATPTGGFYDFATGTGTPPVGWSNDPTAPGNLLTWISTAQVLSGSPTGNVSIGSGWSTATQFSGNVGAPGTSGDNGWTANLYPAIVNYPMLANGVYTPANSVITASFTDGTTTDTEEVYGNINAAGTITFSTKTDSPNISVSQISNVTNRSLTLVFNHTPSDSSATALIQASPVPFANTNSLGGTQIYNSNGTLISTVSSAPVASITYSAGQFFTKDNANVWTPTPVGNLITSVANVVVTRNNVVQAWQRYNVIYNIATSTYTTPLTTVAGGLNTTRFTQGSSVKSATYLNVPITYQDTDGTTTAPITSAIVLAGQNGNAGPAGTRGFLPMAYVVTPSTPIGASQANLTTWFTASRTALTAPIGTGYAPIAGDTAQFTWAAGAGQPSEVYTYNGTTWSVAVGQVISGNVIVTGTVTSNKLAANDIYALNIQSTGANIGNNSSTGFWLQASSGNARFGGNISIGNSATIGTNLVVGNNASIGGNLSVTGLITGGNLRANTVNTTQVVPAAISSASGNTLINGTYTILSGVSPGSWVTALTITLVPTEVDQPAYVWGGGEFYPQWGTGGASVTTVYWRLRWQRPDGVFFPLGTITVPNIGGSGSFYTRQVDFPGITQNMLYSATPGATNRFTLEVTYDSSTGFTPPSMFIRTRMLTLVGITIKR
jgi:hypothetical protein